MNIYIYIFAINNGKKSNIRAYTPAVHIKASYRHSFEVHARCIVVLPNNAKEALLASA
jgi:hypothetical protein